MIIGVIGYGVVGSATAELLRRLGHQVAVRDTDHFRMGEARSEGFAELDHETKPDVLFICVREGHVREVVPRAPECPLTVIRSTVPPGTTESLSEELGRPLLFMPEILREATALWDAMNPNLIVIGCRDKEQGERLAELFTPLMAPIVLVPTSTAAMFKLTLNAYFHTLISFWNEIHLICDLTGVPSHVVGKLCSQDPRVSPYGAAMHGKPAGGTCLPKDLAQLIGFAEGNGYLPNLLTAVKDINLKVVGQRVELATNGHHPQTPLGLRIASVGSNT